MSIKSIAIIVIVLFLAVLLVRFVASATNDKAPVEEKSQLLGVRLIATEAHLEKLEAAAKIAGWLEVKRDKPGSILLLRPKQYRAEQFGVLLEAIEATHIQDLRLQLIGPDGRAVDSDGNPIEEK